jgi:polysaccharide chain length determinant protein (PEP-CTERM system associated)
MSTPLNLQTASRRPPDIEDYIDMLRRYRSWIMGPMFAGLVIAVVVAFLYPDTYRSYAVLRVTPPTVPEQLIPAVSFNQMSERLTQMQTDILSRTTLEEIIRKPSLDLYKKQRQRIPMEDIIQEMKNKHIKLTPIVTGGDRRFASAFQISFDYSDRYKAQLVVRELVNRFTEKSITFQSENAKITSSFLDAEEKSAKERMDEADRKMTAFKMANQGRLPEQVQANTQAMFQLQMQAMQMAQAMDRDAQDKVMLESDLQNNKNEQAYYLNNVETVLPGQQPLSVKNEKLVELSRQIATARSALAQAQNIYGPNYPEIGSMKAVLESLEKQQADLEAEETAQASAAAAANNGASAPRRVANPAVEKRLQELRQAQTSIQAKIQARDAEIQTLARNRAEVLKQIAVYQKRIDEAPVNEQQYAALLSDFNIAKQAYLEMVKKQEVSQTAQNLEERKAGENLEVLDAATLPDKPVEPNRWAWAGFGTLAGLVCGLALAAGKEVKNTALKNLKDVRAYTNLPVLSSVPLLENALLLRRKRRLVWLAWSSGVIIGCVLMLASMYYYMSGSV